MKLRSLPAIALTLLPLGDYARAEMQYCFSPENVVALCDVDGDKHPDYVVKRGTDEGDDNWLIIEGYTNDDVSGSRTRRLVVFNGAHVYQDGGKPGTLCTDALPSVLFSYPNTSDVSNVRCVENADIGEGMRRATISADLVTKVGDLEHKAERVFVYQGDWRFAEAKEGEIIGVTEE